MQALQDKTMQSVGLLALGVMYGYHLQTRVKETEGTLEEIIDKMKKYEALIDRHENQLKTMSSVVRTINSKVMNSGGEQRYVRVTPRDSEESSLHVDAALESIGNDELQFMMS